MLGGAQGGMGMPKELPAPRLAPGVLMTESEVGDHHMQDARLLAD